MKNNKNFGNECWENNYKNGRYNKYPYDDVVSFVKKNYKEEITSLDLGCGGGNNTAFLLSEGHNVIAVDGSATSLELTKRLCNNNKKLKCLHSDLSKLDMEDSTMDCIIDRQSMGHNPKEKIQEIIQELKRVLKPGGKIISFIFSNKHKSILEDNNKGENNYLKFETGPFSKSGYVYFTDKEDIEELFKDFIINDIRLININSLYTNISNEYYIVECDKK